VSTRYPASTLTDFAAAVLVTGGVLPEHADITNYAFHEAIVALSGNALLVAAFGSLSIKNVMMRSFGTTAKSSAAFLEVQRDLLAALERADATAARLAARAYCDLAKARTRHLLALTGGQV
jgi:DNA-binding FadR family transcriptional regulator